MDTTALGVAYLAGPAAIALAERYTFVLIALVAALAAAGLAIWLMLRRRRGALRSWADAACPACLAITVARRS